METSIKPVHNENEDFITAYCSFSVKQSISVSVL